jgi:hypothetical protein
LASIVCIETWSARAGGKSVEVLCPHKSPEADKQIDIIQDILAFSVLCWQQNDLHYGKIYNGRLWPIWIRGWATGTSKRKQEELQDESGVG